MKNITKQELDQTLVNEIESASESTLEHISSELPHKFSIGANVFKYGLRHNPALNCVSFVYEEDNS